MVDNKNILDLKIWILFLFSIVPAYGAKDVDLWKDSLLNKTVQVPHPLIVISDFQHTSPIITKLNRLIMAPFLDGRRCGITNKAVFSDRIEKILPANTPLITTRVFKVVRNPGVIRNLVIKLMSLKELGVKGGPPTYYLVKYSDEEQSAVSVIRIYDGLFYIYKGTGARKAAHVMAEFAEKGEGLKRVLLHFENIREYDKKCGYYRFPEEQKKINPAKEMKESIEAALELIETHSQNYDFGNIEVRKGQIEMDVSYKGLVFLILNSSPLHIKDINLVTE